MQRSVTQKVQPVSTEIKWYEKLEKYRDLFKKSNEKQKEVLESHRLKVLRKDEELAKLIGTESVVVCAFRNLVELYDYCEYVRVRDGEKLERSNTNQLGEMKVNKESLLEQVCGCIDYGIIEKQTAKLKLNTKKEKDNIVEKKYDQFVNSASCIAIKERS